MYLLAGLIACCSQPPPAPAEAPIAEPPAVDNGFIAAECGGIRWDHLPVRLYVDENAEAWRALVQAAADWWGPQYFMLVNAIEHADVWVFVDGRMVDRAETRFNFDEISCGVQKMLVAFPLGEPHVRMTAHELGHVLGLDHDTIPESVMYPTTAPTIMHATAADRERLRIHYADIPLVCMPR
jgi:hypothetical protein